MQTQDGVEDLFDAVCRSGVDPASLPFSAACTALPYPPSLPASTHSAPLATSASLVAVVHNGCSGTVAMRVTAVAPSRSTSDMIIGLAARMALGALLVATALAWFAAAACAYAVRTPALQCRWMHRKCSAFDASAVSLPVH